MKRKRIRRLEKRVRHLERTIRTAPDLPPELDVELPPPPTLDTTITHDFNVPFDDVPPDPNNPYNWYGYL